MEKDVNMCHRRIIRDTLKVKGIDGWDLYPV
jgi:hypothetical protein